MKTTYKITNIQSKINCFSSPAIIYRSQSRHYLLTTSTFQSISWHKELMVNPIPLIRRLSRAFVFDVFENTYLCGSQLQIILENFKKKLIKCAVCEVVVDGRIYSVSAIGFEGASISSFVKLLFKIWNFIRLNKSQYTPSSCEI